MAHKSYIVLYRNVSEEEVRTATHPYSTYNRARGVAAELSAKNPGTTYYVATIDMKVRTEPSTPIFEYFS